MSVRCIGIRMSNGGYKHEHITHVEWVPSKNQSANGTLSRRDQMVEFVENGGEAYVQDDKGDVAYLAVRTRSAGNKYVQTHADGVWTDNLLALPRV